MNPSRTAGEVLHTDRSIPTGRSACGSYLTPSPLCEAPSQSPANLHDSSTKLRAPQEAFPVPLRCMISARQSTERSRQRSASARVPRLVGGLVGATAFITLLTALDVGPDRPLSRLFLARPSEICWHPSTPSANARQWYLEGKPCSKRSLWWMTI